MHASKGAEKLAREKYVSFKSSTGHWFLTQWLIIRGTGCLPYARKVSFPHLRLWCYEPWQQVVGHAQTDMETDFFNDVSQTSTNKWAWSLTKWTESCHIRSNSKFDGTVKRYWLIRTGLTQLENFLSGGSAEDHKSCVGLSVWTRLNKHWKTWSSRPLVEADKILEGNGTILCGWCQNMVKLHKR